VLHHKLCTNASGLASQKSPKLAQCITDDFPQLDVLHCYTHPVTSEAHIQGLDTLWLKSPCITNIAHVCKMYFEWGIEPTVMKHFRCFLWPSVMLRGLLQVALEKDQERLDGLGRTSLNENCIMDEG